MSYGIDVKGKKIWMTEQEATERWFFSVRDEGDIVMCNGKKYPCDYADIRGLKRELHRRGLRCENESSGRGCSSQTCGCRSKKVQKAYGRVAERTTPSMPLELEDVIEAMGPYLIRSGPQVKKVA